MILSPWYFSTVIPWIFLVSCLKSLSQCTKYLPLILTLSHHDLRRGMSRLMICRRRTGVEGIEISSPVRIYWIQRTLNLWNNTFIIFNYVSKPWVYCHSKCLCSFHLVWSDTNTQRTHTYGHTYTYTYVRSPLPVHPCPLLTLFISGRVYHHLLTVPLHSRAHSRTRHR